METTLGDALVWGRILSQYYVELCPHLREDIRQCAMIGAWKAWVKYDKNKQSLCKDASFREYSRHRIIGSIIDVIRSFENVGSRRTKGYHPTTESLADDIVLDGPDVGWEVDDEDSFRQLISPLSSKLQEILVQLFLHADTPTLLLAGQRCGISERGAHYRVTRALQQLRSTG